MFKTIVPREGSFAKHTLRIQLDVNQAVWIIITEFVSAFFYRVCGIHQSLQIEMQLFRFRLIFTFQRKWNSSNGMFNECTFQALFDACEIEIDGRNCTKFMCLSVCLPHCVKINFDRSRLVQGLSRLNLRIYYHGHGALLTLFLHLTHDH